VGVSQNPKRPRKKKSKSVTSNRGEKMGGKGFFFKGSLHGVWKPHKKIAAKRGKTQPKKTSGNTLISFTPKKKNGKKGKEKKTVGGVRGGHRGCHG